MSDAAPRQGLWALLREALTGSEENVATGPLSRAVPLLAIPMALEMATEALFVVVDVYFVAKLGAHAVAAVGLTESLLSLVYAVAFGLAMPTTALVARRVGEGDHPGASVSASQAVGMALVLGVLIAGTALFAPSLLALMGADAQVQAEGAGFTALSLLTAPAVMLLFTSAAVFRGAGDPRRAMRALWLANGLNIVLDPCLIFGWGPFPELGLSGAAVATAVGRGVGVVYLLAHMWRGPVVRLAEALRVDLDVLGRLVRLAVGGTLQHLVETGSWVAMVRIAAELGSVAVAAYTVATRLIMFTLLPAWGFSNATATLVGQSLGEKDPARAERAVWISGLYCTPFLGLISLAFLLTPEQVAGLFTQEPEVRDTAARGLFVVGLGYLFYGWQMVTQQAFNGAGDTTTPARVNVACFWGVQVPLGWYLALHTDMGISGIFAAAASAYTVAAFVGVVLVRRGRWKTVDV